MKYIIVKINADIVRPWALIRGNEIVARYDTKRQAQQRANRLNKLQKVKQMPTIYKTTDLGPLTELTEFKKSLITWAQNQATGKRVDARISKTKTASDIANAKAESYDFMAKYLEGMEIRE